MKYAVTKQEETTKDTLAWIESLPSDRNFFTKIQLKDCRFFQRGKYFIIMIYPGTVAYHEHEGKYCYILDAVEFMKPEIPAKWKTLERLITFRQAIRECTSQGMGLEDLYQIEGGISYEQYKEFIKVARVYDKRHHNAVTF